MRWILFSAVTLVIATASRVQLRCVENCLDGAAHNFPELGFSHTFMVETYRIEIYYKNYMSLEFHVNCRGSSALDGILPSFESLFRVNTVVLEACPPPSDRTYQDVLRAFNVSLEKTLLSNDTCFNLVDIPLEPTLAERHFIGLEHLTKLIINNQVELRHPRSEEYFISPLINLYELKLSGIETFLTNPPYVATSVVYRRTNLVRKLKDDLRMERRRRSTLQQESKARVLRHRRYPRLSQLQRPKPSLLDKLIYGVVDKVVRVNRTRS